MNAVQSQVEPKFDLNTHKRDKRGKIVEINHYRLHCIGDSKCFERPVGSGNLWYEDGSPAGRLVEKPGPKNTVVRSFDHAAEHIQWTPPPTADEKDAREFMETKTKNAALEQELAALKAEREAEKKAMEERLAALEAKMTPATGKKG